MIQHGLMFVQDHTGCHTHLQASTCQSDRACLQTIEILLVVVVAHRLTVPGVTNAVTLTVY